MNLPVDLAAASREELIEVVGQLLSYIGTLEARIAELEGQAKPPTDGLKPETRSETRDTSRLGQSQPASPRQEGTPEAHPRLCPAQGGAHP